MENDLAAKIETRIAELPENIRQAIQSTDLDMRIQAIGKKHQLHIDQIENLGQEIYLTMLAFADPNKFIDSMQEQLNIAKEKAETISVDVNNEIFMPIRDSMKQFAEEQAILNAATQIHTPSAAQESALSVTPSSKLPPLEPRSTPSQSTPTITPAPAAPIVPISTPSTNPVVPPLVPAKPAIPPTPAQNMPQAETMLSQKTVEIAPQPPMPGNYKKDPYREPAE